MQSELSINTTPSGVVLSTACFPPVGYFALVVQHEEVLIDLHETYSKQTWRNRCSLLSGNGTLHLSIPVEKPHGNHTATSKIVLSNHTNWKKNHLRSIVSAYNNAPFFLYYKDLIQQLLFDNQSNFLCEFNHNIFVKLLKELNIPKEIKYSESFLINPAHSNYLDLRFELSPKNKPLASYCASTFPPYYQVFEDRFGFQPNLSILDLLFNLGPDSTDYLKQIGRWPDFAL